MRMIGSFPVRRRGGELVRVCRRCGQVLRSASAVRAHRQEHRLAAPSRAAVYAVARERRRVRVLHRIALRYADPHWEYALVRALTYVAQDRREALPR